MRDLRLSAATDESRVEVPPEGTGVPMTEVAAVEVVKEVEAEE